MRTLHIATFNKAERNLGVMHQMQWEQEAARHLGIEWTSEVWTTDAAPDFSVHRLIPARQTSFPMRRVHFHSQIRKSASNYDQIVVRYAPLDFFAPLLPIKLKQKCSIVFHTKTGEYLRKAGLLGGPIAALDKALGGHLMRGANCLIGVTPEIVSYEKTRLGFNSPAIVYPNGIYLADWSTSPTDLRSDKYKVAFVASHFFPWNGLEKLLESARDETPNYPWELHLVGSHTPQQKYFCELNGLQETVFFHGTLPTTAVNALIAKMDLSLAAFDLGQLGSTEACTLKVRESLGAGVPVYSGHPDCAFPSDFPFYRVGAPRICEIVDHARTMRTVARNEVRSASRPYIDKVALLRNLWSSLSYSGDRALSYG